MRLRCLTGRIWRRENRLAPKDQPILTLGRGPPARGGLVRSCERACVGIVRVRVRKEMLDNSLVKTKRCAPNRKQSRFECNGVYVNLPAW